MRRRKGTNKEGSSRGIPKKNEKGVNLDFEEFFVKAKDNKSQSKVDHDPRLNHFSKVSIVSDPYRSF